MFDIYCGFEKVGMKGKANGNKFSKNRFFCTAYLSVFPGSFIGTRDALRYAEI